MRFNVLAGAFAERQRGGKRQTRRLAPRTAFIERIHAIEKLLAAIERLHARFGQRNGVQWPMPRALPRRM